MQFQWQAPKTVVCTTRLCIVLYWKDSFGFLHVSYSQHNVDFCFEFLVSKNVVLLDGLRQDFIGDDRGRMTCFLRNFSQGGPEVLDHMPVRYSAFHTCYNDRTLLPLLLGMPKIVTKWEVASDFASIIVCMTKYNLYLARLVDFYAKRYLLGGYKERKDVCIVYSRGGRFVQRATAESSSAAE